MCVNVTLHCVNVAVFKLKQPSCLNLLLRIGLTPYGTAQMLTIFYCNVN